MPTRLTYRTLLAHIEALPDDRLDDKIAISMYDEIYTIKAARFGTNAATNIGLEKGHLFLVVNEDGED